MDRETDHHEIKTGVRNKYGLGLLVHRKLNYLKSHYLHLPELITSLADLGPPTLLGLRIQERIKIELLMTCHTPYTSLLHQLLKDGYRLRLPYLNQNPLQELGH
ncbi:MAG: hypothetical protein QXP81_00920 [Nitrososphaerota archaeon]